MQNGYWSDHWTYTLDLVENYLAIFPDHEESLLWDGEKVGFYLCPAVVRPRSVRYKLVSSSTKPGKNSCLSRHPDIPTDTSTPLYPKRTHATTIPLYTPKHPLSANFFCFDFLHITTHRSSTALCNSSSLLTHLPGTYDVRSYGAVSPF